MATTHSTATGAATGQTTVGEEAKQQEHAHPAQVHTHDHYHVTHHHSGGLGDDFDHRAHYHSHEHNHATLVHGHEHTPMMSTPITPRKPMSTITTTRST
jgi:hypothetical protein